METSEEAISSSKTTSTHSSDEVSNSSPDEYMQLQQRIFLVTLIVSVFAGAIAAIFFDFQITTSLLVGSLFGLLYLRLLARSVSRLGKNSKNIGKIQLIAPVLLVILVSQLPQLELIPALLGFALYKPSLFIQEIVVNQTKVPEISEIAGSPVK